MTAASELKAAMARALDGLSLTGGVHEAEPGRAAYPYAVIAFGPDEDWSHKSGAGRELRVAVSIADMGEPDRLEALAAQAEEALRALDGIVGEWRIVTWRFVRSRMARDAKDVWKNVTEFRARMLAEP